MCSHDVYAAKKASKPKPGKLCDLVEDETWDVEYVSASARLAEAVEILRK
jgi:hypothetical protein